MSDIELVGLESITSKQVEAQIVHVPAQKLNIAEFALHKLEECGGSLAKFKREHPGVHLFSIYKILNTNPELKARWQDAISTSNRIRKDLLICKALETLEDYENISSTSSSSDVAFSRAVLFMCGAKPPISKSASQQSEQDEYGDVERDLKVEDDA